MAERLASEYRVQVGELVESRYGGLVSERPGSWDARSAGIDTIRSSSGNVIRLRSSAMQSPPRSGWVIFITGGDDVNGFTWTLYGIPRHH